MLNLWADKPPRGTEALGSKATTKPPEPDAKCQLPHHWGRGVLLVLDDTGQRTPAGERKLRLLLLRLGSLGGVPAMSHPSRGGALGQPRADHTLVRELTHTLPTMLVPASVKALPFTGSHCRPRADPGTHAQQHQATAAGLGFGCSLPSVPVHSAGRGAGWHSTCLSERGLGSVPSTQSE